MFLSTAMIELYQRLVGTRTEGWLLTNKFGEPWKKTTLKKRMDRLCEAVGITKGAMLYSTRHGFISEAINIYSTRPRVEGCRRSGS